MRRASHGVSAALIVIATITLAGAPERLTDAVRGGDRQAVQALLKAGTPANSADPDGTTALQWAARANDVDVARVLLRAGARVDAANRYGVTPLSLAAQNGSAPMIELLLAAGADPNHVISKGQTVLMTAARTGNVAAVTALLDHGADVAAREDLLGEDALMWAASENHPDVVKLLIARGADVNVRSTPLTFPREQFGLEGVPTFLPKGDWTPLMYAARDGATEAAAALADAGAELDAVDPEHATALLRAIANAHDDTAAVLIAHGANPNIADTAGMGPLYAAVDMNTLGEVYGRPPRRVHDAHSALDIVSMLLEHGANPNAALETTTLTRAHTPGDFTLGTGTTPLMRAAYHGDAKAMEILIAHGADVRLTQKNGGTALMLASGLGRGTSAFAEDVGTEADLYGAVQVALAHGADVNAVNESGATAVHYAARSGLNSVVRLLAQHGARLDVKDKQGHTPADAALGLGGRGRAGGPAPVHKDTEALIEQLMGAKTTDAIGR
ncbi:MAG TPA: ankyrin repeat domain-containing protein [Vicinamibacterales bacterium]|nr:ankyrin repeat domain-containing protein [Vicinamibacterales bacterium]